MENGKWKMENGKWKMENGKWKMENTDANGHLGQKLKIYCSGNNYCDAIMVAPLRLGGGF